MPVKKVAVKGWSFETGRGKFYILFLPNGRWEVRFQDQALGSYYSPDAALDDLIGDHCISNSAGLDTSKIGLPPELADWAQLR